MGERLVGHVAQVLSVLDEAVDDLEGAPCVADGHAVRQLDLHLAAWSPQQRLDRGIVDLLSAEYPRLIQQRQRVAGGSLGVSGDRVGRGVIQRHSLGRGDLLEQLREPLHRVPTEIEALAAADDRRRHLVRLGGGEDEADAGRRLLEDLQERVERLTGQALGLVDDVDLLSALHRRGGRLLAELACILHTAVRRRVDLHHVEVCAVTDGHALIATAARLRGRPGRAVDHLGQDPSGRGLAGSAGATEQEGVVETAVADGAGERTHDVILAEDLGRSLRPIPPVERLVLPVLRHLPRSLPPPTQRCDRAPTVDATRLGRYPTAELQPGWPTAPAGSRLGLLPSGPDPVRVPASRGTRPSSLRAGALRTSRASGGDSAPLKRIAGTGHR